MAREKEWFDLSVRRPHEAVLDGWELPPPTRTWTSTHHQGGNGGDEGDAIELVLEGYGEDAPSTMISSGLTLWEASDLLCDYLIDDDSDDEDLMSMRILRLLELGSGIGKCGLLAHHLAHPSRKTLSNIASTVLTDGDTNALQLLRRNVARNTDPGDQVISCQQLIWGKEGARDFLSRQQSNAKFHIILGSDLIYTISDSGMLAWDLFDVVDALLDDRGKFILSHDESHGVQVWSIVQAAVSKNLFHEVLKTDGQVSLLCFRRLTHIWKVASLSTRLQDKISALEAEIRTLRAGKEYLEDKCRCLEERCVSLRSDDDDGDLPRSIMLSFGMDHMISILSFLDAQDFTNLSSTCKQFGLKLHNIGTRQISMCQMIAHRLNESALSWEKEALESYNGEASPFFLYNKLMEVRKPLTFPQLYGRGIKHANGNKSHIIRCDIPGRVKIPVGGRVFHACTAVSDHVMRAGKHGVRFECPGGSGGHSPLWFGIVRPLQGLETQYKAMFSPFCRRFIAGFNELRTEDWGEVQCCVYSATSGKCLWTGWNMDDYDLDMEHFASDDESTGGGLQSMNWQGMKSFEGGTIGLLLDYDVGTLAVYRNDERLGVMKDRLSGPYSWMVSLPADYRRVEYSSSEGVKIERAWACGSDSDQTSLLPCKRELSEK